MIAVTNHDGSILRLRKLAADYDPTDRLGAMDRMQREAAHGELLTGLLYIDPLATDLHTALNTAAAPLNTLGRTRSAGFRHARQDQRRAALKPRTRGGAAMTQRTVYQSMPRRLLVSLPPSASVREGRLRDDARQLRQRAGGGRGHAAAGHRHRARPDDAGGRQGGRSVKTTLASVMTPNPRCIGPNTKVGMPC